MLKSEAFGTTHRRMTRHLTGVTFTFWARRCTILYVNNLSKRLDRNCLTSFLPWLFVHGRNHFRPPY